MLIALLLATLGCHGTATHQAQDPIQPQPADPVADAVAALGTESLEPFTSDHFVFLDGQYVEVPYTISRRGNQIYLNDHPFTQVGEWPPYDYRVEEDPGPPPPGLSPLGPDPSVDRFRDGYWSRKFRYIGSHYPKEQVKAVGLEVLRSSDAVKNIEHGDRGQLEVTDIYGRTSTVGFSATKYGPPPTAEQWLEQRQQSIHRAMQSLRSWIDRPGLTLLWYGRGSSSAGHIRPVLTNLLKRPPDTRAAT